jgi:hypothetical protein
MMMKRGQILGQPIMYIFYAIVAVLILGFGIKMAADLSLFGKDINMKSFKEDINKKANAVYSDSYGSVVSLADIKVPSSVSEICFLDSMESEINLSVVRDNGLKQALNSSYNIISDKNVFIKGESLELEKISILDLDEALICDDLSDGSVDIKFINDGQVIKAQHI